MHGTYKDTPRDKILEWLKNAPDVAELAKLSNEDLRLVHIKRCVAGMVKKARKSQNPDG